MTSKQEPVRLVIELSGGERLTVCLALLRRLDWIGEQSLGETIPELVRMRKETEALLRRFERG